MPEIDCMLFIGEAHGFRPCIVQYEPPVFGGNGNYRFKLVTDKHKGIDYDPLSTEEFNQPNFKEAIIKCQNELMGIGKKKKPVAEPPW